MWSLQYFFLEEVKCNVNALAKCEKLLNYNKQWNEDKIILYINNLVETHGLYMHRDKEKYIVYWF